MSGYICYSNSHFVPVPVLLILHHVNIRQRTFILTDFHKCMHHKLDFILDIVQRYRYIQHSKHSFPAAGFSEWGECNNFLKHESGCWLWSLETGLKAIIFRSWLLSPRVVRKPQLVSQHKPHCSEQMQNIHNQLINHILVYWLLYSCFIHKQANRM